MLYVLYQLLVNPGWFVTEMLCADQATLLAPTAARRQGRAPAGAPLAYKLSFAQLRAICGLYSHGSCERWLHAAVGGRAPIITIGALPLNAPLQQARLLLDDQPSTQRI